MMVEVARLGKPLAIFALPRQQGPLAGLRQSLADLLHPPAGARTAAALCGLWRISCTM